MKYIIACLFSLGFFAGLKAQTLDSTLDTPSFNCYYIDEDSFQCDRQTGKDMSKSDWMDRGGNASTERDRKFNPDGEVPTDGKSKRKKSEVDDQATSSTKRGKYSQPEKESDTGILEDNGNETENGSGNNNTERNGQVKKKPAPVEIQENQDGQVKVHPAPPQRSE